MSRTRVTKLTRDERQDQCIEKWKASNGHGVIAGQTGFGKTRIATKIIKWLQQKHPDIKILVVVPSTTLEGQWKSVLKEQGCILDYTQVCVINTAIKNSYTCDLLILDEIHRYPADTFSKVFDIVKYYMILGLTATFERLDGKHELIRKYAPVVDTVSAEECLINGWVSPYKEYLVVIDPLDYQEYEEITAKFNKHFEFFNYDFALAMSMLGPNGWKYRNNYAKTLGSYGANEFEMKKIIAMHAVELSRAMNKRKNYIYHHPEKYRVAEEIIAHRSDKKIVTFSASVTGAEMFKGGYIYTGKTNKRKNAITLEEFSKLPAAQLNSCKLAIEGLDIPDLSVGIVLGVNSSKTNKTQSLGRVIRFQENKQAEFFTLVLKDTVEIEWWRKSNINNNCIIVDEANLLKLLQGKKYETYKEPLRKFLNRF